MKRLIIWLAIATFALVGCSAAQPATNIMQIAANSSHVIHRFIITFSSPCTERQPTAGKSGCCLTQENVV